VNRCVTIASRLDRRDAPRPHHKTPCPAKFPEQPDTQCEGVKGHEGKHVARVTVEWEDRAQAPRVP
jgi:hypothetical protein